MMSENNILKLIKTGVQIMFNTKLNFITFHFLEQKYLVSIVHKDQYL